MVQKFKLEADERIRVQGFTVILLTAESCKNRDEFINFTVRVSISFSIFLTSDKIYLKEKNICEHLKYKSLAVNWGYLLAFVFFCAGGVSRYKAEADCQNKFGLLRRVG